MKNIAPDIFRKRMLIGGYYNIDVTQETIKKFLSFITSPLDFGRTVLPSCMQQAAWAKRSTRVTMHLYR